MRLKRKRKPLLQGPLCKSWVYLVITEKYTKGFKTVKVLKAWEQFMRTLGLDQGRGTKAENPIAALPHTSSVGRRYLLRHLKWLLGCGTEF